jgi:hypothetical protein
MAKNRDSTPVHLPSKKLTEFHVNALKKHTCGYVSLKIIKKKRKEK